MKVVVFFTDFFLHFVYQKLHPEQMISTFLFHKDSLYSFNQDNIHKESGLMSTIDPVLSRPIYWKYFQQ